MKYNYLRPDASKKERRQYNEARKAAKEKVRVNEILRMIPEEELSKITEAVGADKSVKKLKARSLFKLLIFSYLRREVLSLRKLSDDLDDPALQALLAEDEAVSMWHSGIQTKLSNINIEFFEKIYDIVYEKASKLYSPEILESEYSIKRYDSTLIPVFAHHISGMKVGNTSKKKNQIKFTTEFRDTLLPKMMFFKDQKHLSEETALAEIVLAQGHTPNEVSVTDAGLKGRKTFALFDENAINFVGRLTKNPRFEAIEDINHPQQEKPDGLTFIRDSKVYLFESSKNKPFPHPFRFVEYRINKTGEKLSLVTNLFDLPPQEIAKIYRKRWDIEVFFRFIKQELDFEHFVSYNDNAIMVQVYTKLIVAMFILIFKEHNGILSYKKAKSLFFKELLYSLFYDLLDNPETTAYFKTYLREYLSKDYDDL